MLKYFAIFAIILITTQVYGGKLLDDQRADETGPFTKADCTKKAEQEPVVCRGSLVAFTWDDSKKECVQTRWSGCYKTRNNFQTLDACKKTAAICKY
ncbi:trypsin inhibitor [Aethina tumida]|uniref:trypsin inhibitor n=1 Tax=Aethina tumida TaxID=116153 RepID=UPI00096B22EF|nr:trypsin inhibitor [Aethina tumida]